MHNGILLVVFLSISALEAVQAACDKSPTTAKGGSAPKKDGYCSGELIFEDNFDTLDLNKWKHECTLRGGGNWEFQWYTNSRKNSYVEDGKLKIKPTLTSDDVGESGLSSQTLDLYNRPEGCTDSERHNCVRTGNSMHILNPIKSARITTVDSFSFRYGRVEVSAKLPKGDWLWPAIWMLPTDNVYGTWPASGEIDIVEGRGNAELIQNGKNIGVNHVESTLHWGPSWDQNKYTLTNADKNNPEGFHSGFHKYEVVWSPDSIAFSVDGTNILTVTPPEGGFWEKGGLASSGKSNPWSGSSKMAPFDKEFHLLINLAVGGVNHYFPDNAANPGGKPWSNFSPKAATDFWTGKNAWLPTWNLGSDDSTLQVEYVRVYAI